jgi:hypothetical protein
VVKNLIRIRDHPLALHSFVSWSEGARYLWEKLAFISVDSRFSKQNQVPPRDRSKNISPNYQRLAARGAKPWLHDNGKR